MFVYFIFDGNFICRFLYIFRPSSVPRSHFSHPKRKVLTLIINHLYLQILHSALGSRLTVLLIALHSPTSHQRAYARKG